MSSFLKIMTNPKTGKKQNAFFVDDFYGSHIYGVGFPKDGKGANVSSFICDSRKLIDICDFYKEEELI